MRLMFLEVLVHVGHHVSHYHRTFGLTRMALKTQERESWVPVEAGAENREGGVACRTGYGMATIRWKTGSVLPNTV